MVLRELSRLGKHVLFVRVIEGKVVCTMIRCAIFPQQRMGWTVFNSPFILYVSVRERT